MKRDKYCDSGRGALKAVPQPGQEQGGTASRKEDVMFELNPEAQVIRVFLTQITEREEGLGFKGEMFVLDIWGAVLRF